MRLTLAMLLGRLAGWFSRLIGRGGSAIPGLVAEKIDPRVVQKLVASIDDGVVVVSGTNGKTTTTKMLVRALEASGRKVLTNPTGSNLSRGIASRLITGASLRGRVAADLAVFEVDEAALRPLGPALRPKMIVVTNLARDQLDRYGELVTTAGHIASALEYATDAVLNADDPLVAELGDGRGAGYFGAVPLIRDQLPHDRMLHGDDGPQDPRRTPDALVTSARPSTVGTSIEVTIDSTTASLDLALPGVFNAYNAAAALLAATRLGVSADHATKAIASVAPAFGRGQVIDYRDRRVLVVLVKNPAGMNQAVRLLVDAAGATSVLVAINDNHADGRDVSWLWDARIEDLAVTDHRFGASGLRAEDMALRFKYAGINSWSNSDLKASLDMAVEDAAPGDLVYVIPTYTAMLDLLTTLLPGVTRTEAWT